MGITHATPAPFAEAGDGSLSKTAWEEDHVGGFADPMTTAGDMVYEGGGVDRARSGTATAFDTWSNQPPNTIDGNEGTLWSSNSEGTGRIGGWLKVDLGTAYTIASFRVYQSEPANHITSYKIQSSTNNTDWADRYVTTSGPTDSAITALDTSENARYWRWYIVDAGSSGMALVYTFSLFDAVVPTRLAVGSDNYVMRVSGTLPNWEAEFDATAPTTQAFGDSAAVGSADTAARRDHKHAMPVNPVLLSKYNATAAPANGDDSADGYSVGSLWVDVTGDTAYICVDSTVASAVWKQIG
jgi:hypothetical protein